MSNVIQFTKKEVNDEIYPEDLFSPESNEAFELIEIAEEVSDAIKTFTKMFQLSEIDSDDYRLARRELRIIKEFYRLKEYTSFFDNQIMPYD